MAETSPVEAAIGSASSEMDLAEPEPVPRPAKPGATCKGCGNAMAAGAVLCTSCGMNQQTGQKLGTAISREKAPKIPGKAAAVGMLLLKIGGAMVGTVAVVAILAMVNLEYAKYAAIAITAVIGVLIHIVGTRGAIIEATDGNLGMRLLCRFVPFLALILITMRCTKDWESMKTHVLTVSGGRGHRHHGRHHVVCDQHDDRGEGIADRWISGLKTNASHRGAMGGVCILACGYGVVTLTCPCHGWPGTSPARP